ncbi:MAG: HAMP domain-containing sensor histidine kinase, partial [Chromatiales bacterium]
ASAPPDTLLDFFRQIQDNGKHLLGLINDLLDLSKMEAGQMKYHFESYDLNQITAQCIDSLQQILYKKGIQAELQLHTERPVAECDSQRIYQVMTNLLSNAIKFSPADSRIEVEIADADIEQQPALAIAVKDQGIGIPEDELETVFDKFIQSSKTRSGKGGTGLGLSISREIVQHHRGVLSAENRPDGGACFRFVIPVSQPHT